MTKFSKTLVVISFVLSISFAAFAGSLLVGGVNWQSEANQLEGYTFVRKSPEGQPVTWDVIEHVTQETVAGSVPHLAKAVTAARLDLQKRQEAKIKELDDSSSKLKQSITEYREILPLDKEGVNLAAKNLSDELVSINEDSKKVSEELVELSKQIQATRNTLRNRREDVYRLSNQVEVVETDAKRINEQISATQKQITLLEAQIGLLKQRKAELEKQLQN